MRKKLSSLAVVGALLVALPVATMAKGPEKKIVDYVALGDSLAAGVTPDNKLDFGYADYLVDRFEQSQYTVGFDNFAVPGYTSENVNEDILSNKEDIQQKMKEAEFITIDIGANDLLRVLNNPAQIPAAMQNVAINLQVILSTIDTLNPNAKVYVMGYYNPFPNAPEAQQSMLLSLLDTLNQVISGAAESNGDTYVPTQEIIAEDYETYLPNPENIHLSEEGYKIVAKEFWKNIDKSKD